jgi:hypothetical protein
MIGTRHASSTSPQKPPARGPVLIGDDDQRGSNGAEQLSPITPPQEVEEIRSRSSTPPDTADHSYQRMGPVRRQETHFPEAGPYHQQRHAPQTPERLEALSPERPETPVDDLALRLEALQREVHEGAKRVQQINSADNSPGSAERPKRETKIRWGEDQVKPMSLQDWPASEEEDSVDQSPQHQHGHGRGDSSDSDDASDDDDPELAAERVGPSGGGGGGGGAAEQQMQMEELVNMRKRLEAQANESDGAALGTGSLFKRPSPADLLRGVTGPPNPPAPNVQATSSASAGSRVQARSAGVAAPAYAASGGPARPSGPIQHEGLLRKKKEDHGRFEDPYKMVCVCRLQVIISCPPPRLSHHTVHYSQRHYVHATTCLFTLTKYICALPPPA